MKILRRSEYRHEQLSSSKTGELYSLSAILSKSLGSKDFFIHHEILSPGRDASAAHAHLESDEYVLVLKGQAIVHFGEKSIRVDAGDSICFAAGSTKLHRISNESSVDVELLVITKKLAQPDVVFEGTS